MTPKEVMGSNGALDFFCMVIDFLCCLTKGMYCWYVTL